MALADLRSNAVDPDFPAALFDTEELIIVRMDFFTNILTRTRRHEQELQVLSGVERTAEGAVFLDEFLRVVDYATLHSVASVGSVRLMAGFNRKSRSPPGERIGNFPSDAGTEDQKVQVCVLSACLERANDTDLRN